MKRAVVALALGVAACGEPPAGPPLAAASGSRLSLTWFAFDDGARLPDRVFTTHDVIALYDRAEQTGCASTPCGDGVTRCIPQDTGDAVYTDTACTQVVGLASALDEPAFFIASEEVGGYREPTHLYRGGAAIAPIPAYYERRDGVCTGAVPLDPGDGEITYAIAGEVDLTTLPAMQLIRIGEGRLQVDAWTASDGLIVPVSWFDRELGSECRPATEADGTIVCATGLDAPPGQEAPAELQRHEEPGGDRLERIVYEADGLRLVDDRRLYDTAIRSDCWPRGSGDMLRCLPETAASTILFTDPTCAIQVQAVVEPQPLTPTARFAHGVGDAPSDELHLISDVVGTPLYAIVGGACTPYDVPSGGSIHALGPAIDPSLFVHAVRFEER